MAFLDVNSVSKSYGGATVLENINLEIEEGEFVVFVGPSGCGKSTLLRMISGLESISSGTVSIEGRVVNDVEPALRGVAMVFQSYALYPHMTTSQNISFGLRMAHKTRDFIGAQVQQATTILQLDKLLDRKPGQLSGGQKQRVAIGRAIVREPRVFLFDEPLSNLDAELRVQMRAELTDLHRRLGTTMIYVTHDQVEAMTLADKMVVLSGGRIQQVGKPLDLYDDPNNSFVAGFVGSPRMNFLPANLSRIGSDGLHLTMIAGSESAVLPLVGANIPTGPVDLGLRPEHLQLVAVNTPHTDGLCLSGKVALVEELGAESFVHMTLADETRLTVRAGRDKTKAGLTVRVQADLGRALLFGPDGGRIRRQGA